MNQEQETDALSTLVVDDESGIRFFLKKTLEKNGYRVDTAADGQEALDKLRDVRFDLMMLDLKLGGEIDGLDILQAVRWRWPATVVIILTAHGSLDSARTAIEEGVDGYLLKPIGPQEVRRSIKEALQRRQRMVSFSTEAKEEARYLECGPFSIDRDKYLVTYQEKALDLSAREFELLAHLVENAHRVIGPRELVQVVRDYEPQSLQEAREILKWYIHRLRQAVEPEPETPRHIVNVRGVGYRFVE